MSFTVNFPLFHLGVKHIDTEFSEVLHSIGDYRYVPLIMCSGGSDSMALVHRFSQIYRGRIAVYFYRYDDPWSNREMDLVLKLCNELNIDFYVEEASAVTGGNLQEKWREQRYNSVVSFCREQLLDNSVAYIPITAHNLDDVIETSLSTFLKNPDRASHNFNPITLWDSWPVVRPITHVCKQTLKDYCTENRIKYFSDPNNYDYSFQRTVLRRELVPMAFRINPGLYTTFRTKQRHYINKMISRGYVTRQSEPETQEDCSHIN